MKIRRLFPAGKFDGNYIEDLCIYAARRCRTTKSYKELEEEVGGYSEEKRHEFLTQVIFQDWAADVLEMATLTYDIEGVPVWLVVELLRHRLIAREFSLEQLSQRAISAEKLEVEVPDEELQKLVNEYIEKIVAVGRRKKIAPEILREVFPQGVLVNFVISGNLRAFHHFWWMRSSPLLGGKGGAHVKFQAIADQMLEEAREVYPNLTEGVMKA